MALGSVWCNEIHSQCDKYQHHDRKQAKDCGLVIKNFHYLTVAGIQRLALLILGSTSGYRISTQKLIST